MKAYPYLSLIRCLVHYILDSCSMYYFHNMSMILCGHTFLKREVFMQHMLRMGIDVGSTTVKVVLLDEHDNYLYKKVHTPLCKHFGHRIYLAPRGSSGP